MNAPTHGEGKKLFLRSPKNLKSNIVEWLVSQSAAAEADGGVFGLSGGVDSAVVAALAKEAFGKNGTLGVIMPCHSLEADEEDALLVAKALDILTLKVDLSPTFDVLTGAVAHATGGLAKISTANIKPRLRMTTLYAIAQERNFLVCGTSNKPERIFGYFTKHGDSGADILPIADLLKHEIWELARYMGVPEEIITKPPSAGLWDGQTDEKEMGVTYEELDTYVSSGVVSREAIEKIQRASTLSAHKRNMPPMPCPPR